MSEASLQAPPPLLAFGLVSFLDSLCGLLFRAPLVLPKESDLDPRLKSPPVLKWHLHLYLLPRPFSWIPLSEVQLPTGSRHLDILYFIFSTNSYQISLETRLNDTGERTQQQPYLNAHLKCDRGGFQSIIHKWYLGYLKTNQFSSLPYSISQNKLHQIYIYVCVCVCVCVCVYKFKP